MGRAAAGGQGHATGFQGDGISPEPSCPGEGMGCPRKDKKCSPLLSTTPFFSGFQPYRRVTRGKGGAGGRTALFSPSAHLVAPLSTLGMTASLFRSERPFKAQRHTSCSFSLFRPPGGGGEILRSGQESTSFPGAAKLGSEARSLQFSKSDHESC